MRPRLGRNGTSFQGLGSSLILACDEITLVLSLRVFRPLYCRLGDVWRSPGDEVSGLWLRSTAIPRGDKMTWRQPLQAASREDPRQRYHANVPTMYAAQNAIYFSQRHT